MKNLSPLSLLFLVALASMHSADCTPLVYNMKIRRVFSGINAFLDYKIQGPFWPLSILPIVYHRKAHVVTNLPAANFYEKRIGGGALVNLRYVPDRRWWLEGTTAIQRESVSTSGTSTLHGARTGLDDIVFAGGYNFFPSEQVQITPYGLVGFPTKYKVTLLDTHGALVGSRFYGLGAGVELSYGFINETQRTFAAICQLRFVHFFTRPWQPILPSGGKIQPGNITDVLFGLRYRHKLTVFEVGYNPTIFTNQALLLPTEKISTATNVRHGVYASLTHLSKRVKIANKPLAIGVGFNFNRQPRLDANTIIAWLNFTLII